MRKRNCCNTAYEKRSVLCHATVCFSNLKGVACAVSPFDFSEIDSAEEDSAEVQIQGLLVAMTRAKNGIDPLRCLSFSFCDACVPWVAHILVLR